jgi:hypothetical protein
MMSFNFPTVGQASIAEELKDYNPELEFVEIDNPEADYGDSNNMYPDVAFFWFGVTSFGLATMPMSMYITFLRDIYSVPSANTDKHHD